MGIVPENLPPPRENVMKPEKSPWYLQRIRAEFPWLKWSKYRRVQTHSHPDHVMFLLDNGIAFRFESELDDEDTNLARELAVLELISPHLAEIPIPNYTYVPDASIDFAGYRTIPGARLFPWRFERMSKASRLTEASRLGRFLSALHRTPLDPVRKLGVVEGDRAGPRNRATAKVLLKERGKDLDRRTRNVFRGWAERSEGVDHAYSPVLAHDDLWCKHIYHDPRTGKLTGIIDWGDIAITDPAKDFYGFWVYGEAFLDDVLSHYDKAQDLKDRSFEHFWGIAVRIWFDTLDGRSGVAGHFFHPSTWSKRPLSDWPLARI